MIRGNLTDYQIEAIGKMFNGCILNGGVGSGKSRTSIAYYYIRNGGQLEKEKDPGMKNPKDLYIITTAKKRDTHEWEAELPYFLMSTDPEVSRYKNKIIIDSWNNIHKYEEVHDAFFIFDEQRLVGTGAWTKSFQKIVKRNEWILLTATSGDQWTDYAQVFIANGYFRNITEFRNNHVVYNHHVDFPQIDRYINEGRLIRLRNHLLIPMDFERETVRHNEDIYVTYDTVAYHDIWKNRWNYEKNEPMKSASEVCYAVRKVVNSDISRQIAILELFEDHPRMIIFYSFDYELDILKGLFENVESCDTAEWNGHKHQPIPESGSWVYLVQYTAGCEGWNCIKTDTIVFYSQTYSYKVLEQARGRIDRLNTPFRDLYYYHLKSRAGIDLAISQALAKKKTFNEGQFFERRTKNAL